ncbi:NADH-ubiquinone oxidoreductase-F iron-sulfur binding region domain-containing protein [Halococcus saccharolyticus]|uniref:Respiratory-chain NADH dehydrogenase domain 51 kDa subunit n=1 Tax=Halococcus saccharolyticus DSM 5350 TaxID=1227455 RepID=M0MH94_9EURY|nr:NADH-ubiquinone oxidoreductase-F iron-sulfur binding region domain-containing protein [Halococcus saccharolyticus]EMA45076.1 respiratory-chain NADH dehydrogenase domain 51 kDa subunit [Halococcus saccharolyticus DSM 5350]
MATPKGAIGNGPVVRVAIGGDHDAGPELLRAARDATEDVRVVAVGPTGADSLAPLVLATQNGTTAFVPQCTVANVTTIVETLENGSLPDTAATVEHDPGATSMPTPPAAIDTTAVLGVGSRRVLGGCGWRAPASVADYRVSRDDELLAERAIDDPDAVHERVADAALRGRGRGDGSTDAPISGVWTTATETDGKPVVVVNANEADDHARADRLLLESAPLAVLDAALATAHAVDATDVLVYTNDAEALARERAQEAADALAADRDPDIPIQVVAGPDAYTAGEMTMALEAMEGNDRLEARRRPPGPDQYGLYGRPTVIHTPRTFAQVGQALADNDLGGVPGDPGTRLFTVAGDVDAPATIELPTDATLADVRGAVALDGGLKTACVGGRFGGLTRDLDVPASAAGLRGARLGTNGVIELFDESTCTVALAGQRAKLAREENCGRCVPCREGSKQLVELLRDVYDGEYQDGMLRELARTMRETSTCEFGQEASRPVTTAMESFEPEFRAHADGRCPSGSCDHVSS